MSACVCVASFLNRNEADLFESFVSHATCVNETHKLIRKHGGG
jgi:hypothetical protein